MALCDRYVTHRCHRQILTHKKSHILIDYDGNARLSIAAHDTSSIHHHEETLSAEDLKDCSYMAPETRPRPKHNYFTSNPVIGDSPTIVGSPMRMGGLTIGDSLRIGIIATMGSDVYEMAMVIYEVRESYQSVSFSPSANGHIGFLGFDGGSPPL